MKKMTVVFATSILVACGNPVDPGPSEPDPGFVAVSLDAINAGTGALQLTIASTGSVVDSLRSVGFTFFSADDAAASVRSGIVIGNVADGEVVRFWVPDRNELTGYQVTIEQAAAAGSYAQIPVNGIGITLTAVDP